MSEEKNELREDEAQSIAAALTKGNSKETIVMDKVVEIASWIAAIRQPEKYNPNVPFAVVPENMKVINVEKHMPHPSRIRKNPIFVDVQSFCSYFNSYEGGHEPKIFACKNDLGLQIKAVMDMDVEGENVMNEDGSLEKRIMPLAQWNDHTATLMMKFHEDYAVLRRASGNWYPQRDFALFIEELNHLFVDPVGADMLELAQELRGTRTATWRTGKRLDNNQTSIQYVEEINAEQVGGSLKIPQYITLRTPLYEGLDPVEFKAAFSYDIDEDHKVSFSIRLLTKLEERQAEEEVKNFVITHTNKEILNVFSFEGITPKSA